MINENEALSKLNDRSSAIKLSQLSKNEVLKLMDELKAQLDYLYPTMENREAYELAVAEKRVNKEEDFSLLNRGALIDAANDIISAGGFSNDYLERVNKHTELRAYKRFWVMYSDYRDNGEEFPDFDFHLRDIKYYIFHILDGDKSIDYIRGILIKLMRAKDTLEPEHYEAVKNELEEMLHILKEIAQ